MQPNSFPANIEPLFQKLREETIWLHRDWKLFRQLYGTSESRVDLLNEVAGVFFNALQWIMLNEVILSICRLLDRPQTMGKQNLVYEAVIQALADHPLAETLSNTLDKLRDEAQVLMHRRNRKLAHLDRNTALFSEEVPLPGISRKNVETVLSDMRNFMNAIERCFSNATTAYDSIITSSDGNSLTIALRKALDYDLLVKEGVIPRDRINRIYRDGDTD